MVKMLVFMVWTNRCNLTLTINLMLQEGCFES